MIYFLTVNYYSTELIKQLFASITTAGQEYGKNYNFLIVNNSSEDTSVKELVQIDPRVTVLAAPKNLGFGAGCNLGIQYVYNQNPQAFIWLINPDTIIDKTAISYIEQCFNLNPSIAILGTRIRNLQGEIWFSLGTFNPWLGSLKHQFRIEDSADDSIEIIKSRWVSGCSLILNLKQFEDCPGFDTHYFLYYEDADLCERYYQLNYPIAVTKAILVTHIVSAIGSRTPQNKFRHATYSKLYFIKQHGVGLSLILNLVYMLFLVGILLPKNKAAAFGKWQGLKDFLFPKKYNV